MLTDFVKALGGPFDVEQVASRQLFKRAAKVEEVPSVVLLLLSDEGSFITGAVYPVSGGWDV